MTIKIADSVKTLVTSGTLDRIKSTYASLHKSYVEATDIISTLYTYASQPKTLLAYAVTEFLPIGNVPIDIVYLAFDDGSYIAFDDGSLAVTMEI